VGIGFEEDIFVEVKPDSDGCSSADVEDDVTDVLERLVASVGVGESGEGATELGVNVPSLYVELKDAELVELLLVPAVDLVAEVIEVETGSSSVLSLLGSLVPSGPAVVEL
jgi:hypothetical protein